MRGQPGTRDYPEFPAIEAEIGYNPAKWLHTQSESGLKSGIGQTPEVATAMAIVKGIDDPKEIAYWLHVEKRTRDRQHVKKKLNQRRLAIKHGRDGFLEKETAHSPGAAHAMASTDGGQVATDGDEGEGDGEDGG